MSLEVLERRMIKNRDAAGSDFCVLCKYAGMWFVLRYPVISSHECLIEYIEKGLNTISYKSMTSNKGRDEHTAIQEAESLNYERFIDLPDTMQSIVKDAVKEINKKYNK